MDDEAVRHSEAGEVMGAGFHQVFAVWWRPRYQEHTSVIERAAAQSTTCNCPIIPLTYPELHRLHACSGDSVFAQSKARPGLADAGAVTS